MKDIKQEENDRKLMIGAICEQYRDELIKLAAYATPSILKVCLKEYKDIPEALGMASAWSIKYANDLSDSADEQIQEFQSQLTKKLK